jgi:intracellular sulfur oxidation DsrE/DsrF family protein
MRKKMNILTKPIHTKLFSAFLMSLCLLMMTAVLANERYGKQKVVYHINYDNPKQQAGALRNIQNHINAVGAENLDLKVVLHGNGLALLLEPDSLAKLKKFKHANADDTMTAKIDGLKSQGVEFNVCENTVRGRKVNVETDLYNVDKKDIVPSGVAEVARLQAMGYAYIKP